MRPKGQTGTVTLSLLMLGLAGASPSSRQPVGQLVHIATVPEPVTLLASSDTLYIASAPCPRGHGCSFVYSMPLAGGGLKVLNSTPLDRTVAGLAITGNELLVAMRHPPTVPEDSSLATIPLAGGPATLLDVEPPTVDLARVTTAGDFIYIVDSEAGPNGSGVIFRMPRKGGPLEVVAQGPPLRDPVGIAASKAGDALYVCDYNGPIVPTPSAPAPRPHNDPGEPGMIFRIPLNAGLPATPQLIAQGGMLKNPADLVLVGNTLYVADEGATATSPPGIYSLPLAGWTPGQDWTSHLEVVYQGKPFVEPMALAYREGNLYIGDDGGHAVYRLPLRQERLLEAARPGAP